MSGKKKTNLKNNLIPLNIWRICLLKTAELSPFFIPTYTLNHTHLEKSRSVFRIYLKGTSVPEKLQLQAWGVQEHRASFRTQAYKFEGELCKGKKKRIKTQHFEVK